jgi:uncharacterized protein (TIGR02145 family)
MDKICCLIGMLLFNSSLLLAQVGINTDGSAPDSSAILEVKSTTMGFLPPRMTTVERNAIASPAEGLLIFNLTTGCIDYFLGGSWKSFCGVSEPVFQCGMKFTDARDGKMYNTVRISTQCWMAQSLNIGTKVNGSDNQTDNSIIEKYCYGDLETNCDVYGGLYQWDEAMQYVTTEGSQGICPSGWHLPTDDEFSTLSTFLGGESLAGGKMKSKGTIQNGTGLWFDPNTGATNSSGFTALPGSGRHYDGLFYGIHSNADFWSSSQNDETSAWFKDLYYGSEGVGHYIYVKTIGFSIRCIRD